MFIYQERCLWALKGTWDYYKEERAALFKEKEQAEGQTCGDRGLGHHQAQTVSRKGRPAYRKGRLEAEWILWMMEDHQPAGTPT